MNLSLVKSFLEDCKSLGSVRIIVNTGVAVLEAVTTFEGLFYSEAANKCDVSAPPSLHEPHSRRRRGEWANIIKPQENVDLHLMITRLSHAKLDTMTRGDYQAHVIRVSSQAGDVCVSFFLMWPEGAARGAYADGQVAAFEQLKAKHGEKVSFLQ